MSKHTHGPWKFRECGACRNVFEITGPDGSDILCGHYVGDDIDGEYGGAVYGEANARLIAAAPELIDALIGMVKLAEQINDASNEGGQLDSRYDAAVAAIAKATGGQE